jgi:Coenzyme Q (ubiquinone) biosynthesis protein Coq4
VKRFFKNMRKKFLTALYLHSQRLYTALFKSSPEWGIRRAELLKYDPVTLGYQLGRFLNENNFELIPKVERHDIYHILTGYGISVEEEIALQYLLLGNGKRSLYSVGAVLIGTLVLPEYFKFYTQSYSKGKCLKPLYCYDYRNLLEINFPEFRDMLCENYDQTVGEKWNKAVPLS